MSPRKRKTTPEQTVTRRISKAEHVPDSIIANNKHNTLTIRTSRKQKIIKADGTDYAKTDRADTGDSAVAVADQIDLPLSFGCVSCYDAGRCWLCGIRPVVASSCAAYRFDGCSGSGIL
jgi:hypothetical protein